MIASDPELGKFGITTRLFKLIGDMPKDQQLILLKQLVGDAVSRHLYKLIVEMTEEQQIILLEQMGQLTIVELPVRTVSLEETESSMRENPRKACLLNANYSAKDRIFRSSILDISIGGVFIETNAKLPIGEKLHLKFSLPNHSQPFTFSGKIVWNNPKGFGVKFNNVTPLQGDILKSFVDKTE